MSFVAFASEIATGETRLAKLLQSFMNAIFANWTQR